MGKKKPQFFHISTFPAFGLRAVRQSLLPAVNSFCSHLSAFLERTDVIQVFQNSRAMASLFFGRIKAGFVAKNA